MINILIMLKKKKKNKIIKTWKFQMDGHGLKKNIKI